MKKDYWPIDGTKHHDVSRESLYTNTKIDNFLDNDSNTLLIAAKGMGKTLLLRAKKKLLEDDPEGILIIPRNAQYDDPQLHGSYPQHGMDYVSFWEDLWKCSIIFSILSHHWKMTKLSKEDEPLCNYINQLTIDDSFKKCLIEDIADNVENNPSYYLAELLGRGIRSVQKFLKTTHKVDAMSDKYISHSISVFIDN